MSKQHTHKEYRLSTPCRRYCIYLCIAMITLIVILLAKVIWMTRDHDTGMVSLIFLGIYSVIAMASLFIAFHWRLCVSDEGVSRRLFLRWDFWSWTELSNGKIQKRYPYTLLNPERPWWKRQLSLRYLSDEDIQEVMSIINEHYQIPPPPVISDVLSIKSGSRYYVKLTQDGIHVTIKGRHQEYSWSDIRALHILRQDQVCRDFMHLVIVLPDREVELGLSATGEQAWCGASSEEINEFLYHHIADDRIHIAIYGQSLNIHRHLARELDRVKKTSHEHTIGLIAFSVVCVSILMWAAFLFGPHDVLAFILYIEIPIPFMSVILIYAVHEYLHGRQRIRNLTEQLKFTMPDDSCKFV